MKNARHMTSLAGSAQLKDAPTSTGLQAEAIQATAAGSSVRSHLRNVPGMTPAGFRSRSADTDLQFAVGVSSLGSILVAASNKGIAAILMGADPAALIHDLEDRFPKANLIHGHRSFAETLAKVVALVDCPAAELNLPLDVRGTAFQSRVWQALRDVPAGTTVTYGEIAERIGLPEAARAVAAACAANKIAVAIPCHRVVRNDGSLSGYRWGVERKRTLLDLEARHRKTQPAKEGVKCPRA